MVSWRAYSLVPAIALWAVVGVAPPCQAAPSDCRPVVALEGPADLVVVVGRMLQDHGVGGLPVPGCPLVRAHVTRDGTRVQVTILEVQQPHSQREFDGEDQAASFIESWTRNDITAPLLVGTAVPVPPPAPV